MRIQEIEKYLSGKDFEEQLRLLYGDKPGTAAEQRRRYGGIVRRFREIFPSSEDILLYSAPGRTEIGGNHTDHQHGCALAAAVNLDAAAAVSFCSSGYIRLYSEGYGMTEVDLSDLGIHEEEKGKSAAIVRGVCARFRRMGAEIGGFDAYVSSDVVSGSGLSSSAAFETLIATILNSRYFGCRADAIQIAQIGQYAENVYFGKGSGLLDQTVCSVGGFVFIDFRDTAHPAAEKIDFDFSAAGYDLCVTDTKGSHADLTDDYVAVPREMRQIAAYFDKEVLREVEEEAFFDAVPDLHGRYSDRAVLRAMHFFGENRRAAQEARALKEGDIGRFFTLYRRSAASSAELLQNLYSIKKPGQQGIPLAIAVSKRILGGEGAVRVHGGGFAGTIQAFVPKEKTAVYTAAMDALFGAGSCYVLRVRPVGGVRMIKGE